ncbi:hypothetical protein JNB_12933 [Janibacter sp. HTCC2649]|uniref:hypothetical protein n=1 Tax=Janibacter sp. HTCC2649 TaxID=313589 RepID=UPI00006718E8|nr:hypothetical protein [Janibacter sp. HTCC2649]EAP97869.1 hypothetical protein JNB_12933 [Janibacter sp. HTCC2649]
MSIYESATAAIRDTVKWLTAFIPTAALTAAALVVGPDMVASARAAPSLMDWAVSHGPVLLIVLALFASIAGVLFAGQQVLTVQPIDLADLQTGHTSSTSQGMSPRADVARAMGAGIAMPYFFDKATYDAELVRFADADVGGDDYDARASRLALAGDAIRQWSIYDRIRGPYRRFKWTFVGANAVIAGFLVIAPALLEVVPSDGPNQVRVTVNENGRASLLRATGCTDPSKSSYYVIGGSWDAPSLGVDGPNCSFRAVWEPRTQDVEVRPIAAP